MRSMTVMTSSCFVVMRSCGVAVGMNSGGCFNSLGLCVAAAKTGLFARALVWETLHLLLLLLGMLVSVRGGENIP